MNRLGLPSADAEDLVQTAWERWLATQPAKVEAWLRIVIRRLAIDAGRRHAGLRPGDPLERDHIGFDVLGAG